MKSAADEMIRLTGKGGGGGAAVGGWILFVTGCNRSGADVVQNARGDAKASNRSFSPTIYIYK